MQKHEIKSIDEIDDKDKGEWRECDIEELYTDYFNEPETLERSELQFGFYTPDYFRDKFPGLPEEAYNILASERYRLDNININETEIIEPSLFNKLSINSL